jgi:hypothetical protein
MLRFSREKHPMGINQALIEKYRRLVERKNEETSAQRLLNNEGLNRWFELRELIKDEVQELNNALNTEALVLEHSDPTSLIIRRRIDNAMLNGSYAQSTNSVSFMSAPSMRLDLYLHPQGETLDFIYRDPGTGQESIDLVHDIAYGVLDKFLSN